MPLTHVCFFSILAHRVQEQRFTCFLLDPHCALKMFGRGSIARGLEVGGHQEGHRRRRRHEHEQEGGGVAVVLEPFFPFCGLSTKAMSSQSPNTC